MRVVVLVASSLLTLGGAPGSGREPPPDPPFATELPPAPWRGVTVDEAALDHVDQVVDVVASSTRRLTVRVVFDPAVDPAGFDDLIAGLAPHADLMGQVMDSSELRGRTPAEIAARTEALVDRFGADVDLWEVGNELNGAWVGRSPRVIADQTLAAFEVVRRHGGRSAITLNFWSRPDCYSHPWEATIPFAAGLPERLTHGVDAVLLSVYETACAPRQRPRARDLAAALVELGRIFPRARLGIGEIGAQDTSDGQPADPPPTERARTAARYYGQHGPLVEAVGDRYVGGYFWWYFVEDAVLAPRAQSLWPTLDVLLAEL